MEIAAELESPWYSAKTSARLLAAQGAYSMIFSPDSLSNTQELLEHLYEVKGILGLDKIDKRLLLKIIRCMIEKHSEIDTVISEHISDTWSMDRINLVSLSIMRAGVCELLSSNTNRGIIINEYVGIASYILEDAEINFVNAILNKVRTAPHSDMGDTSRAHSSGDEVALLLPKNH